MNTEHVAMLDTHLYFLPQFTNDWIPVQQERKSTCKPCYKSLYTKGWTCTDLMLNKSSRLNNLYVINNKTKQINFNKARTIGMLL